MRDLHKSSSMDEHDQESDGPSQDRISRDRMNIIKTSAAFVFDPCMLQCLFTTVLPGLHGAGGSSTGATSGGSSSQQQHDGVANSGGSTSAAASQCCAQYLSLLRYNRKLFDHLSDQDHRPRRLLSCSCCCFMALYSQYTSSMSVAAAQELLQQPASTEHQELHLLLPPLLLAWAASAQHASTQHKPAGPGSDLMQLAASCSITALEHWACLQQRQQGTPQIPAGNAGPLLRELLPQVLDTLSHVVLAPSSASAAAPSSTAQHPAVHDKASAACGLLSWLLQHTPTTAQHTSTCLPGASDQGAALLAAAAWRKHAPKLSTVLEALVRSGPGCSLEPILQSSTGFAAEVTHILIWWGDAGHAAMTLETSAQEACRRQSSCMQLLLDAAVAAKSTKAQLQHCSLLESLLKHSSAALTATSGAQPFQFGPAAGTGSSPCSTDNLSPGAAGSNGGNHARTQPVTGTVSGSGAGAAGGQPQQEQQPGQRSPRLSDDKTVQPVLGDTTASSSNATTTGADGRASSSVHSVSAGAGQRRGKNRTAARTRPGQRAAGGWQLPQAGVRQPKASEASLGEDTWLELAKVSDAFLKRALWQTPCVAFVDEEDNSSSSAANSSSRGDPYCATPGTDTAMHALLAATLAVAAALHADWAPPAAVHSSTGSGSDAGTDGGSGAGGGSNGTGNVGGSDKGVSSGAAGRLASSSVLQEWQSAIVSRCCIVLAEHLPRLIGHTVFGPWGMPSPPSALPEAAAVQADTTATEGSPRVSCLSGADDNAGGSGAGVLSEPGNSSNKAKKCNGACKCSSISNRGTGLPGTSTGFASGSHHASSSAVLVEVATLLDACRAWTARQSINQQLPAVYDAAAVGQAVQDAVDACSAALNASVEAFEGQVVRAAAVSLAGSLAVLGRTLGAVATPLLCNNPSCINLTGDCELRMVKRGKNKMCGKCQTARYCSVECQTSHWKKQHRRVCKQLAAACTAAVAEVHSGSSQPSHS